MKKCKILKFKSVMETFLDSTENMVSEHPEAEKIVEAYLNDGYEWIVDIDLEKFFIMMERFMDVWPSYWKKKSKFVISFLIKG